MIIVISLENISKVYRHGDGETIALNNITLAFEDNEFVAILGPSGCGKTTLLNIMGGLDTYTQRDLSLVGGSSLGYRKSDVRIAGKSSRFFNDADWDRYRNDRVGFVFQTHNLIGHLTVYDNVELSLTIAGLDDYDRKRKVMAVLKQVGMDLFVDKLAKNLSSGQKQRVAIARAIVNEPDVILADEPTGALDSVASKAFMELIKTVAKGKLVVMVTHNETLATAFADRIITLKDGSVVSDTRPVKPHKKFASYSPYELALPFAMALKLSLKQLRSTFGRSLITALAGGIGIAGIALVFAFTSGLNQELDRFEDQTLSSLPVVISEFPSVFQSGIPFGIPERVLEDSTVFNPFRYPETNAIHFSLLDHVAAMDPAIVENVHYRYGLDLLAVRRHEDGSLVTNNAFRVPFISLPGSSRYLNSQYSVMAGTYPTDIYDIAIIVDITNTIDARVLDFLGITHPVVEFQDVIGIEVVVPMNDDIDIEYDALTNTVLRSIDDDAFERGITLTVKGVLRPNTEGLETDRSGMFYHPALEKYFVDRNLDSVFCETLNDIDQTEFTDQQRRNLRMQRSAYGCRERPLEIQIYPVSNDTREAIITSLDDYNDTAIEREQIIYVDFATSVTGLLRNIITNVSRVLIAFAAVALVVSSIMIGVLTYVGVLERTREIGLLRSLGARKRDVAMLFNIENALIGFVSGMVGIVIAIVVQIPINIGISRLFTGFEQLMALRFHHVLLLLLISVVLSLLSGLIPARKAAVQSPVEALRHND